VKRAAVTLALGLILPACGERPMRDLDASDDLGADVVTRDLPVFDTPPGTCRDAVVRTVPTTLTAAGRCTSSSTGRWCDGDAVKTCGTQSGEAVAREYRCGAGERCVMRGERGACEPAGVCVPGATRCNDRRTLARCDGGAWVSASCAGRCVGDALAAACVDLPTTRTLRASLRYARRIIAANLLSWGETVDRPARGFSMRYRRGDTVLARGITDAEGRFTLEVPATSDAGDVIEAVAALGEDGRTVILVGDPGLPTGPGENPAFGRETSLGRAHAWPFAVPPDGATLSIPLDDAPGASVFDDLATAYATVRARAGVAPRHALAVWVRRGVRWDCGACFSELLPTTVQGQRYDGQLWLTGDTHENWWSPAVTLHEFGHWVMSAWGTIPHEGGAHFLGVPTFPGLAWSEGWATFASSDLRDDPRHYAVAGGTFFWWNIAQREIYNGARWQRPNPDAPLLQAIDENEVSAILWALRGDPAVGSARVLDAVRSPRMNLAPFGRCNTQTWVAMGGGTCTSGEHAPHLADVLDALRCDGVSERSVRVAAGTYPYPASAPICVNECAAAACAPVPTCSVGAPMSLRANGIGDGEVSLRLTQPGDLGASTTVRVELPAGVWREGAATRWTQPAHTDGTWTVSLRAATRRRVTVTFVAEAQSAWAGARATAQWTGEVPGGTVVPPSRGAASAP
jgi:hypothetical protein